MMFLNENPAYAAYDIGDYTYGLPKIFYWAGTNLKIGKFCSIASEANIFLGGNHTLDFVTTYPFNVFFPEGHAFPGGPLTKGDIEIGHDVWIASGASIMSGVRVGSGAVIGADCIVARDVPPYAIMIGNPARIMRYRFERDIIEQLLEIQWWDWPIEQIKEAFPLILSNNIEQFVQTYGRKA
ncbi:acetyltransferase-like isoleucine patch superfamily enzyme [Croceifilum oryzae]|uniref:Acetyltransferase-like isoleucine patch superfamily enzyme n=1 Tax=Croceifilum oryzae TaxID=1553429 RepID=A0AAJ1TK47_9BACL|nr:CatB-related O-acetyltransferase [Croceifilum oryzae]MDQ0416025.1 acetyltransferase-like isoleucine patch superfamily enzyme [Croceifilum oryzae]